MTGAEEISGALNEALAEMIRQDHSWAALFPSSPDYHYWTHKAGEHRGFPNRVRRYAYTTERARGFGKDREKGPAFFAIVYEGRQTSKDHWQYRAIRTMRCRQRKRARAKAYEWFQADCRHAKTGTFGPPEAKRTSCKVCAKELTPCGFCNGVGTIPAFPTVAASGSDIVVKCPDCGGSGWT